MCLDFINKKPETGVIAGVGSGLIYFLKTILTNDFILKIVAGLGIWLGLLIALLTIIVRVNEIIKTSKEKQQ